MAMKALGDYDHKLGAGDRGLEVSKSRSLADWQSAAQTAEAADRTEETVDLPRRHKEH